MHKHITIKTKRAVFPCMIVKNEIGNRNKEIGYLGGDYIDSIQPGLSFSPLNRVEIVSHFHYYMATLSCGLIQNSSPSPGWDFWLD